MKEKINKDCCIITGTEPSYPYQYFCDYLNGNVFIRKNPVIVYVEEEGVSEYIKRFVAENGYESQSFSQTRIPSLFSFVSKHRFCSCITNNHFNPFSLGYQASSKEILTFCIPF